MFTIKNYISASSVEEAYELRQRKNSAVLGGTCWLKMGHKNISNAIDLNRLGLDFICEDDSSLRIGAMTSLRELETSRMAEAYFGRYFHDVLSHIVGVQFRNCATVGGSIYSRFGFSDMLCALMPLDCTAVMYKAGEIPLCEFARHHGEADILLEIAIKKSPSKHCYLSQRNTQTDISVLTYAAALDKNNLKISVGALPSRPVLTILPADYINFNDKIMKVLNEKLMFASDMRASAQYRRHICEVFTSRTSEILRSID